MPEYLPAFLICVNMSMWATGILNLQIITQIQAITMQIPLQVSFRHMEPSGAVEADVREKVAKLEHFCDRITSCRVVIEAPHQHQHKGNLYQVRIDITVPGREIAVTHEGPKNHAHEDVYVAVRDAFNAAGRQLEDYARKIRGQVKHHEPRPGSQD